VDIAINLVMIIISAVLIFIILLQTKGSSFSGAFGGGSDSIQRTRRGFEKTLFQFTIGIATFFVGVAVISSLALG
jgi:preprotein translocase subunit SecG